MSAVVVERDDALSTGEPWPLPEGWVWAPLEKLGVWTGGGTPSKAVASYWTGGAIPWVSPKEMKSAVIKDTQDKITEKAVQDSATKFIPPNSVLMVMRSGILRHTFPVAVNQDRVTLNQDLRALSPFDGVNAHFVAHYLRLMQRAILHECSKDGTTVQSIEVSALGKTPVPIAPLPEQRRIVARIDSLFTELAEGEAALERAGAGLNTWRRALLKAVVTGELTRDWRKANSSSETASRMIAEIHQDQNVSSRPTRRGRRSAKHKPFDLNSLPKLPANWAWARMDDVISSDPRNGISIKGHDKPPGTAALKLDALSDGGIDYTRVRYLALSERKISALKVRRGDFLISRANGSERLVGKARLACEVPIECVYPDTIIRYRIGGPALVAEWVNLIWESDFIRAQIVKMAKTTAGILKISQEDIARIVFPVPPPSEIAECIDLASEQTQAASDALICLEKTRRDRASLRQSILKSAFHGVLLPQDFRDKPASVPLGRMQSEGDEEISSRRRSRARTGQ
jgi:type I restriction enzyme S subunit